MEEWSYSPQASAPSAHHHVHGHTNRSSMPSPTLTNPDMILPFLDDRRMSVLSPPSPPLQPPPEAQLPAQSQSQSQPAPQPMQTPASPTRPYRPLASLEAPRTYYVQEQQQQQPQPPYAALEYQDPRTFNWNHAHRASFAAPMQIHAPTVTLSAADEEEAQRMAEREEEEAERLNRVGQELFGAKIDTTRPMSKEKQLRLNEDDDDFLGATPRPSSHVLRRPISEDARSTTVFEGEEMLPVEENGGEVQGANGRLNAGERRSGSFGFSDDLVDDTEEERSASLSRQAEWILATAKRKLNALEGSLSRARHSLVTSPDSSYDSGAYQSTTGPSASSRFTPNGLAYIDEQDGQDDDSSPPARVAKLHRLAPGHGRIPSDASRPRSLYGELARHGSNRSNMTRFHSSSSDVSARPETGGGSRFGVGTLQGEESTVDAVGQRNYFFTSSNSSNRSTRTSFLLSRSSMREEDDDDDTIGRAVNGVAAGSERSISSNSQTSMNAHNDPRGSTRSRSAAPIREVRDQMEELKGRISSLQMRANHDHHRRSVPFRQTPSPGLAAEQWYLGAGGYGEAGVGRSDGTTSVKQSVDEQHQEQKSRWVDASHSRVVTSRSEDESPIDRNYAPNAEVEEMYPEERMEEEEEEHHVPVPAEEVPLPESESEAETSELADIREAEEDEEFHQRVVDDEDQGEEEEEEDDDDDDDDEFPSITSERHEDRADAFDYEHFFLHSGMGNYSARDLGRRDSYTSEASVETARPGDIYEEPEETEVDTAASAEAAEAAIADKKRRQLLERNISSDSFSSEISFTTAAEGRGDGGGGGIREGGGGYGDEFDNMMETPYENISSTPWRTPMTEFPEPTYGRAVSIYDDEDRIIVPTTSDDGSNTPTQDDRHHHHSKKMVNMDISSLKGDTSKSRLRQFKDGGNRPSITRRHTVAASTIPPTRPDRPFDVDLDFLLQGSKLNGNQAKTRNNIFAGLNKTTIAEEEENKEEDILKGLSGDDRMLIERLVGSLKGVCRKLHSDDDDLRQDGKEDGSGNGDGDGAGDCSEQSQQQEKAVWRARLEAARSVLDGAEVI
ncbi:MAG: hypothetical protein M1823_001752 [Watsoniomyces obsoletus]|nr:MAG: hypothetical protein M1823_001752 [Watsoniomyces obsoletus]